MKTLEEMVKILNRTDIEERDRKNFLSWWCDDIFKLVKNINDTSTGEADRQRRIIELEEKYQIPKTHLI